MRHGWCRGNSSSLPLTTWMVQSDQVSSNRPLLSRRGLNVRPPHSEFTSGTLLFYLTVPVNLSVKTLGSNHPLPSGFPLISLSNHFVAIFTRSLLQAELI
jgi:hypothetical protein